MTALWSDRHNCLHNVLTISCSFLTFGCLRSGNAPQGSAIKGPIVLEALSRQPELLTSPLRGLLGFSKIASWNGVYGRGCDEAAINEEKCLFAE